MVNLDLTPLFYSKFLLLLKDTVQLAVGSNTSVFESINIATFSLFTLLRLTAGFSLLLSFLLSILILFLLFFSLAAVTYVVFTIVFQYVFYQQTSKTSFFVT